MNIFLWILQSLLALHTLMGAGWKLSNPVQTVSSLQAMPHAMWIVMSIIELFVSVCLILPAFNKRLGLLAPLAAAFIAVEMLIFTAFNIFSAKPNYDEMVYWLVVAAICVFIVYGRLVLKPVKPD
jgi:uncharacterized membrane protein YphA (DoxX/SURF4 family)